MAGKLPDLQKESSGSTLPSISRSSPMLTRTDSKVTATPGKKEPAVRLPFMEFQGRDRYDSEMPVPFVISFLADDPDVPHVLRVLEDAEGKRKKRLRQSRLKRQEEEKLSAMVQGARCSEDGVHSAAHPRRKKLRKGSRVLRLLEEFGGKDDWASVTILRHQLITIIQATYRGYCVRKVWRINPRLIVESLHLKLCEESAREARKAEMRKKLEDRMYTRDQKTKLAGVMQKMFGPGGNRNAAKKWGNVKKGFRAGVSAEQMAREVSESSGDSDIELEDVAAVKFRARTPPWQRVEESQYEGQKAKLNHKMIKGNLDVLWDSDESINRVIQAKIRRQKKEGGVPGNPSARSSDTASMALPPNLVNCLLAPKYIDKYKRLGMSQRMPLHNALEMSRVAAQMDPTFVAVQAAAEAKALAAAEAAAVAAAAAAELAEQAVPPPQI